MKRPKRAKRINGEIRDWKDLASDVLTLICLLAAVALIYALMRTFIPN